MKYKHIEASREARLWLTQIILPVAGIVMAIPESRKVVLTKANEVKNNIKTKFKK